MIEYFSVKMPSSDNVNCEKKILIPSIHVTIHPPTTKNAPEKEEKAPEIDPTNLIMIEKSLGMKITGGADFKMPLAIFDVKLIYIYFLYCITNNRKHLFFQ